MISKSKAFITSDIAVCSERGRQFQCSTACQHLSLLAQVIGHKLKHLVSTPFSHGDFTTVWSLNDNANWDSDTVHYHLKCTKKGSNFTRTYLVVKTLHC